MSRLTTNFDEVINDVQSRVQAIDIRNAGSSSDQSVARMIQAVICDRILDRIWMESDPAGQHWAENEPRYKRRKHDRQIGYGPDTKRGPGGYMKSQANIYGKMDATRLGLKIYHGITERGSKLLQWFTNGSSGNDGEPSGARNQPERPVIGYDETTESEIVDLLREALPGQLTGGP